MQCDPRDETIRRMDADGALIADIAKATGLSESAVRHRRLVLGLGLRRRGRKAGSTPRASTSRVDVARARQLMDAGCTVSEAARAVGTIRQGLQRLLERWRA